MNILGKLQNKNIWLKFLEGKKMSQNMTDSQIKDMESFIMNEEYIDVVSKIQNGEGFNPPLRKLIAKQNCQKKRVVYTFSREENYVLKLMTYLLIRRYDCIFAKNLYSFRSNHGVKEAIDYLRYLPNLSEKYVYKVDVENYFNSVDNKRLLPILKEVMNDNKQTYAFIENLLKDSLVCLPSGETINESKGIMAGVPISSFLANVFLNQLDWCFYNKGQQYLRYSDDIIVFSDSLEQCQSTRDYMHQELSKMSLSINKDKEYVTLPHEQWDFLGIAYKDGIFDISPMSITKLKKKMWRKSRALLRWKNRKQIDNIYAAKAFVKTFNRKLYDNQVNSELTWSRWFFPMINTSTSLLILDHYMQDCVRYIATESRTNKRFRFNYDMIKELGYRPLVHEYYKWKSLSTKS